MDISSNPEQNFPADSEVLSNVKIAIKINSETSQIDSHVSAEDNIVTVSGAVDSLEKAKKVESIIGQLSGVKDVINLLTVVPTQAVSDEIIARAIVESFKQNSDIDEAKLDVVVENGIVALRGRVLSAKTAPRHMTALLEILE